MMPLKQLKSGIVIGAIDWRTLLMRLILTVLVLAAIIKIGS
jgi:hypothetical protein